MVFIFFLCKIFHLRFYLCSCHVCIVKLVLVLFMLVIILINTLTFRVTFRRFLVVFLSYVHIQSFMYFDFIIMQLNQSHTANIKSGFILISTVYLFVPYFIMATIRASGFFCALYFAACGSRSYECL